MTSQQDNAQPATSDQGESEQNDTSGTPGVPAPSAVESGDVEAVDQKTPAEGENQGESKTTTVTKVTKETQPYGSELDQAVSDYAKATAQVKSLQKQQQMLQKELNQARDMMNQITSCADDNGPVIATALKLAQGIQGGLKLLDDGLLAISNSIGTLGQSVDIIVHGTTEAINGVEQLRAGTQIGTARLNGGLADLGSDQIGLRYMYAQTEKLKDGTVQLAAGTKTLADNTPALVDGISELDAGMAALVQGTSKLSTGASQLDTGVGTLQSGAAQLDDGAGQLKSGIATLDSGAGDLKNGAHKLDDGVGSLQSGAGDLQSGAHTLDNGAGDLQSGAHKLYDGSVDLDNGAGDLYDGTVKLDDGAGDLYDGTVKLDDGARDLYDGTVQLDDGGGDLFDGIVELDDGAGDLLDGAIEVHDGMVTLNDDGIEKITSLFDQNTQDAIDRFQAVLDAGESYTNFSGAEEDSGNSVKFVIRTGSIGD